MLEARGITFAHAGASSPLYEQFSLAVKPGERVALCAPSGAGKTTLCRILAGYERPQEGEVLVDGEPLPLVGTSPVQLIGQHPELAVDPRLRMQRTLEEAGMADFGAPGAFGALDAAASSVPGALGAPCAPSAPDAAAPGALGAAAAFSAHAVPSSTVVSGVRSAVGAPAASGASDMLDALGIRREWLRRYPHELSGGELQRFCIARAVAAGPRYLIADEITTMLDAVTQAQIWAFLLDWQARANAGMVIVTHSPALLARLATRIVSL